MNEHEKALFEAGERLGQAMQNAPDEEKEVLRAMYGNGLSSTP